jgi:hypothetical protein
MAMTAWSANVSTSLICRSVNGRTASCATRITPNTTSPRRRGTGGGLILERLLQISFTRLLSLQQPCVLDGNDGLVGEGLEQINLPVGERPHLGTSKRYCANCSAGTHQRDNNDSAVPLSLGKVTPFRKVNYFGLQVSNVDRFFCQLQHVQRQTRASTATTIAQWVPRWGVDRDGQATADGHH